MKLSSSDNIHPLSLRQAKTCVNKCAKLKFGLHSPLCLVRSVVIPNEFSIFSQSLVGNAKKTFYMSLTIIFFSTHVSNIQDVECVT